MIQWNGHRVFGVLAMSRSIGMCFLIIYLFNFVLIVFLMHQCGCHASPFGEVLPINRISMHLS